MRRQGRKSPKKYGFFCAPKWTARTVVRHLKEKRIAEILQNEYGVTMGSSAMLEYYQKASSAAVEELSLAEYKEMQQTAELWNNTTEPDSVKAR